MSTKELSEGFNHGVGEGINRDERQVVINDGYMDIGGGSSNSTEEVQL